ncbi:hypothetical protein DPMN_016713 [Dreissena polymorpha]|uniref:Uncharacterized protein n=1 Tax=Dreissena polymorpha TaxID=45954 RepID=A0A9D4S7F7_DREPO|nr:hypothetical protein DPMN_016713 [Dreissena polymorpha]
MIPKVKINLFIISKTRGFIFCTCRSGRPSVVQTLIAEGEDVLSASVSDSDEQEIFACNINEDGWADEMSLLQSEDVDEVRDLTKTNSVNERAEMCSTEGVEKGECCEKTMQSSNITLSDLTCIPKLFKTTKDCNKSNKWNATTPRILCHIFKQAKV